MARTVKHVAEGFHTVTPALMVRDAERAIEFYKRAFAAEEVLRMPGPGGRGIGHAEIRIGDSMIMLSDEWPGSGISAPQALGGTTGSLHIYVADVDAAFKRAVDAGAKVLMPVADMFWGDRYGKVTDPFGHIWGLATHKEEVPPEELNRRAEAFYARMAKEQKA
jgi:PhnB protein